MQSTISHDKTFKRLKKQRLLYFLGYNYKDLFSFFLWIFVFNLIYYKDIFFINLNILILLVISQNAQEKGMKFAR